MKQRISRKGLTVTALLAVTLSMVTGAYFIGAHVEHVTHALEVSRITGAPYLQVLSPIGRAQALLKTQVTDSPDDEEVCSPSQPCESNQD